MTIGSMLHRHLDPGETLGEVMFGLIMVLTVTIGARLLAGESQLDARQLAEAAVGCNVAWGIIDAVLFVLGSLFHRSQRARFYRRLTNATNAADAVAAVEDEFGLEDEPIVIRPEDRARLHEAILALSVRAAPARARLRRRDLLAALVVFALVSATALPGVIPLLLIADVNLALQISNWLLVFLLFVVGYWWGHYTDIRPWRVSVTVLLLGASMVILAIVLGG